MTSMKKLKTAGYFESRKNPVAAGFSASDRLCHDLGAPPPPPKFGWWDRFIDWLVDIFC